MGLLLPLDVRSKGRRRFFLPLFSLPSFLPMTWKDADQGPLTCPKLSTYWRDGGGAAAQWQPRSLSPLFFAYKNKGRESKKKRTRERAQVRADRREQQSREERAKGERAEKRNKEKEERTKRGKKRRKEKIEKKKKQGKKQWEPSSLAPPPSPAAASCHLHRRQQHREPPQVSLLPSPPPPPSSSSTSSSSLFMLHVNSGEAHCLMGW